MHEDEGSFVSDLNNSYGDDQLTEETTKDPVEEDTHTSPYVTPLSRGSR